MNEEEKRVLESSVMLWHNFLELEVYHADDTHDFKFHMHAIQAIVMKREAIRNNPDLFNKMESTINCDNMRVTATLDEKDHLCNYCGHEPATCPKASHLKFGTGVGNDNVIECSEYVPISWDNIYPVVGKPELGVFPKGEVRNNK